MKDKMQVDWKDYIIGKNLGSNLHISIDKQ